MAIDSEHRKAVLPGIAYDRPPGGPLTSAYSGGVGGSSNPNATGNALAGLDYNQMMGDYDSILKNSSKKNTNLDYVPINPVFQGALKGTPYQRSGELNSALTGLEDYSKTGGYSDADVGNIRERSISPIRSIYSSAQEGLKRQKVLSGGYSPNQGAVSAKMAREASAKIGDVTTKVNADIAQMIASGKLSGLQSLGNVASRDNELSNEANVRNTDLENKVALMNSDERRRTNEINSKMRMDVGQANINNSSANTDEMLKTMAGKTSLYGTTPGFTSSFGNDVMGRQDTAAIGTANQIKNQRTNTGLNLLQNQLNIPRAGRA